MGEQQLLAWAMAEPEHVKVAREAWTDAAKVAHHHESECESGCTLLMSRCLIGMDASEAERAAWRAFDAARRGVEVGL